MAKVKKRQSRFASEAALRALVRFGPELSGLLELQRQAEETYKGSVRQARGIGQMAIMAADRARPQVRDAYERAGLAQARMAQTLVGRDLAGLGQVADSIKAGAALEQAAMGRRMAEAQAAALTDLSQRRTQAASGAQFAVENARRQFVSDLAKIIQRRQDLARERGAFEAATVGELEDAERDRETDLEVERMRNTQSERNSLRSAGIDPDTGKPIPGGKLDQKSRKRVQRLPGGAKLATPGQHGTARDRVQLGVTQARQLRAAGLTRREIAPMLVNGVRATAETAGVKPVPELYASVALDLVFDGHVSRRNRELLHRRGLSLSQLGYRGAAGTRPKRRRAAPFNLAGQALDGLRNLPAR